LVDQNLLEYSHILKDVILKEALDFGVLEKVEEADVFKNGEHVVSSRRYHQTEDKQQGALDLEHVI
jgi:hypothetical protein